MIPWDEIIEKMDIKKTKNTYKRLLEDMAKEEKEGENTHLK